MPAQQGAAARQRAEQAAKAHLLNVFLQVGHALAVVAELVEGGLELVVVARAAGAAEAKASSAVAPALVVHLRHDDQEAGGGTLLRARGELKLRTVGGRSGGCASRGRATGA